MLRAVEGRRGMHEKLSERTSHHAGTDFSAVQGSEAGTLTNGSVATLLSLFPDLFRVPYGPFRMAI